MHLHVIKAVDVDIASDNQKGVFTVRLIIIKSGQPESRASQSSLLFSFSIFSSIYNSFGFLLALCVCVCVNGLIQAACLTHGEQTQQGGKL
jgi:hypothetical protein